ncbi:MAG: hypothetical protein QME96_18490 [Myxococcota bacterium]|nr:hypothetical protein [Myxococcota bacterium]
MTDGYRRNVRAVSLAKVAGLAFVVFATAAPLPGDAPGCFDDGGIYQDDSPGLGGDALKEICIWRCREDCRARQACGIEEPWDDVLRLCYSECSGLRSCARITLDTLCAGFGDPIVTANERTACVNAPRYPEPPDCWCNLPDRQRAGCWPEEAWVFPAASDPPECHRFNLCDPRN